MYSCVCLIAPAISTCFHSLCRKETDINFSFAKFQNCFFVAGFIHIYGDICITQLLIMWWHCACFQISVTSSFARFKETSRSCLKRLKKMTVVCRRVRTETSPSPAKMLLCHVRSLVLKFHNGVCCQRMMGSY